MKPKLSKWISYHLNLQWTRLSTLFNVGKYLLYKRFPDPTGKTIFLVNLTSSPRGPGLTQFFLFLVGINHRLKGHQVYYIACTGGGSCPQGVVRRGKIGVPAPCNRCRLERSLLFAPFKKLSLSPALRSNRKESLILSDEDFLPSLRHLFKRYHLEGSALESRILNQFKTTALALQINFQDLINTIKPDRVILFNGVTYPEKTIREVCLKNHIDVYTYEVGFRDLSAFFTTQLAPAYEFSHRTQLSAGEMATVDDYMKKRISGQFEMGLTKFWDKFETSDSINSLAKNYKQVVTIFTNSVFDTSTVFSNRAFSDLFECLESLNSIVQQFPDTLFIFRSHPDEFKRIPFKENRVLKTNEKIDVFLKTSGLLDHKNTILVGPTEFISSYDLVKLSKFIIVYNSTIGVESIILGTKVIVGGAPKYERLSFLNVHSKPEAFAKEILVELNRESKFTYNSKEVEEAKAYLYQLVFEQSVSFNKVLSKNRYNQISIKFNPVEIAELKVP